MNDQEKPQVHVTGAARSAETARSLIRKAKRATRRRFTSEDKIRILMEGIRGELAVAELCRREGIHATVYYKWLKTSWRRANRACLRYSDFFKIPAICSSVNRLFFKASFSSLDLSGS